MTENVNPQRIVQMPVKEMPVPNRPRRWLQVAGVRTVGDLVDRSEADLLTIENFVVTSLGHVKRFLNRHGLSLRRGSQQPLDLDLLRAGLRDRGCKLTRREREIVKLRYGIADGRRLTLEEAGRLFDLSRERVRQIQKQAEQKILARQVFKRKSGERQSSPSASMPAHV